MVKNPSANARETRDAGLIPGLGRSPGEGNGNPLQYFCLENPMDRGAWQTPLQPQGGRDHPATTGLHRVRYNRSDLAAGKQREYIQLRGQTSCLDDVSKNQQNKSGIMPQPNLASTDSKCLGKESSNHVYHHAQVQELPRKPPKWGISSVQSCLTLRPHELQHARPSCPSPTPRAYSNSCLSSR